MIHCAIKSFANIQPSLRYESRGLTKFNVHGGREVCLEIVDLLVISLNYIGNISSSAKKGCRVRQPFLGGVLPCRLFLEEFLPSRAHLCFIDGAKLDTSSHMAKYQR